jgi:hypothetical protein
VGRINRPPCLAIACATDPARRLSTSPRAADLLGEIFRRSGRGKRASFRWRARLHHARRSTGTADEEPAAKSETSLKLTAWIQVRSVPSEGPCDQLNNRPLLTSVHSMVTLTRTFGRPRG